MEQLQKRFKEVYDLANETLDIDSPLESHGKVGKSVIKRIDTETISFYSGVEREPIFTRFTLKKKDDNVKMENFSIRRIDIDLFTKNSTESNLDLRRDFMRMVLDDFYNALVKEIERVYYNREHALKHIRELCGDQ